MTIRLDILTLELFVATVEEQSIGRAAEKKHIAVSAVSRRISDLEATLKLELLRRGPKGIEVTPAGLALLDHARTILGHLAQLETELLGHRQGTRGHVRLFANKSAILESLGEELASFLAAHPQVSLELEERISPEIVKAVAENRADLGIFGGNIPAPELTSFPYREDRLVALVASEHPLAPRTGVRFADMLDCDFVSLEKGSSIDTLCVKAAAELGRQLKLRVRVSGFDAVFRLVEATMGVGIVPSEIAAAAIGARRLATLTLDEPWAKRSLVLGVRDPAAMPTATRLLVEHLRTGGSDAAEARGNARLEGEPSLGQPAAPASA